MDNNFMNFRLKLIFLALCILILLAIKGHIKLGYAPGLEKKSIAVAFDYYGAFEKEVEVLVSRLEEAYMELNGIKNIHSVSEPGKGYILCMFSDKTRLDEAYVQISDITSNVWADFPRGVNRPSITRSSKDTYPVYISYFPLEKEGIADLAKKAYEAVPGVGNVELGGRKKKELMVELKSGRPVGMALPGEALGSRLRSSNLVRKVAMPDGQTLVLSSCLSSTADFGQVQITPGLKLSDVADIKYQEAESQSLGHIDGQSMLLFFIMKSGEGNTVRLCRDLEKVTSQFSGSQLYSLGNKIEKSFMGSSSMLLLLFIFLLFGLWFRTRSVQLAVQVTCRCTVALLAAVAAVSVAGLQVDMTVMVALFLVVIFSFMGSSFQNRQVDHDCYIQENMSDDELKVNINSMKPSMESVAYKKKYYDDIKYKYAIREFITSGGKKFNINTPIKRKPKQHEINEAYYLYSKGYKVEFLDEPSTEGEGKHPDFLLNSSLIVETRQISGNVNTAVKRIRMAINKQGVDFPIIFFIDNAVELTNKEIFERLNRDTHIKRKVEKIFIIRNYKQISILNKKAPGTAFAEAWHNSNITRYVRNVNLMLILFTLIVVLYTSAHIRNLVLPFCTALTAGSCASVLFLYVTKRIILPRFRIPLWSFSPILLFTLFFIPYSTFSPFATDVSFSLEYESGTSFSFVQQSALEVESALLKWNAFDRLTLHIDQGRAAFTILGGKKREIMAKISELASLYPEIFFYIPEKHTHHAVDVTVYGNDIPEIENNILQLAKYVNKCANNVNIIYNFKSDVTKIVLEIPMKCVSAGLYPHDIYKTLYYTASEPVVDKYFADDVETDVKIRGDARYRETLAGLLSVPVLFPFGMAGEAGDYINVHRESAQGRIYHKNRMRVMSFSVTGISRSKLRKIVSDFPFTGSCHVEVGQ
jgi:hypothetical protein